MYLFWNFDIPQESSVCLQGTSKEQPKIHLGGYPSSLEDAQGSSTGEIHPIRSGPPSLQQEALWFRAPSLVQACSGQLHQSKGGEKRGQFLCFVVQWWKWVGQNLWKFVIHHHTYCRFCVLLPHICVQFVLYMYISYHSSHCQICFCADLRKELIFRVAA